MATATNCPDRCHPMARLLLLLSVCLSLPFASAMAGAATPQFNYLLHCSGCHIEDGSGMADVVPDLNEELGYFASIPEGRSYLVRVPGSSHSPLSDSDLAEVLNWMLRTFAAADSPEPYTVTEITANRRIRMNDVQAVRKQLLEQKDASVSMTPQADDSQPQSAPLTAEQQHAFGEALFFDTSLSRYGNQACASCHDPGRAFSDPRSLTAGIGASIGSDGTSTGHRNAPSLTYVAATPAFTVDDVTARFAQTRSQPPATAKPADGIRGGFFWDGREPTLENQVLSPFINAGEMGLHDLSELAERVANNERYQYFVGSRAKGRDKSQEKEVLARIADSLATYLRSDTFNSYDSRYDRFVRGEITPTTQEIVGMGLFFSPSFTNCATCHQSANAAYAPGELFSTHRYENIGTPINRALLGSNGLGPDFRDPGLARNPALNDEFDRDDLNGRFKIPGLRNVAVTAPYMHNGVFAELDTVMRFYNHYNESGNSGRINPETGQPWAASNNPDGIAHDKLRGSFPLSERQLAALSAFLRMLTDQRYEHLLTP